MKYLVGFMVLMLMVSCSSKKATGSAIEDLNNPQKIDSALVKLEKAGPKSLEAYPKLLSILKKDDAKTAPKVLRVILKMEDKQKMIEASKVGISSKHRAVSTLAVNSLKSVKKPGNDILNVIVDALTAPEQFTKEAAILASGELKIKAAVPELIKILLNKSDSQHIILNKQAARSLGQIGDASSIRPLINSLFIIKNDKKNRNVGTAFTYARNALTSFGKDALKEVLLTLDGKNEDFLKFKKSTPAIKDSDVLYNLIVMIGEIGNKDNLEVLKKYIQNEDTGVRTQAEVALGNLRIAEAAPLLIKRYQTLKRKLPRAGEELASMVKELTNINRMLAQIGSKEAHQHLASEILGKPVKVDGEEYTDLKDDAASSFSLFAGAKYYDTYKKFWASEKDATRKKGIELYLKVMEVPHQCKDDAKCYIKFLDKKSKKDTFKRQKAAYMLSRFTSDEAKNALFFKALFDKDIGVRAAAAYSIEVVGTKADLKTMDKAIEKALKKHSMKKSMSLLYKVRAKLNNK